MTEGMVIAAISGVFGFLSAIIPVKLRERKLKQQPEDYTKTLMTGFQDLEQITRNRLKEMHEENSQLRELVKSLQKRQDESDKRQEESDKKIAALQHELKLSDKKIHELEAELSKYKGE